MSLHYNSRLEDIMKKLLIAIALMALAASPALADRSMAGGTCTIIAPATANPGDTVTFEFLICNNSTDAEWTAAVYFTFPTCMTVLGGSYDPTSTDGHTLSFVFTNNEHTAFFDDGDGGYGEIYGAGDCGTFYVDVAIGTDCECGPVLIHWEQIGDVYGAEPHFVEGDESFTLCETPADDATWSAVKSLY